MEKIDRLVRELCRLPGVGQKTALRLAYNILKWKNEDALNLAQAIVDAKEKVKFCPECFNLAENGVCPICTDHRRDKSIVCVVEEPQDAQAVERTGSFRGVYHVLHGAVSPLDGVGPDELRLVELSERLKKGEIVELIIATNPTAVGEATAFYIAKIAKPTGIKITRIAFGIPFGGDIEYVDRSTLAKSLESRLPFDRSGSF